MHFKHLFVKVVIGAISSRDYADWNNTNSNISSSKSDRNNGNEEREQV